MNLFTIYGASSAELDAGLKLHEDGSFFVNVTHVDLLEANMFLRSGTLDGLDIRTRKFL